MPLRFPDQPVPASTVPRKVVLTGGNGYVGSELVRQLLAQGAEVHALVHQHSERLLDLLPEANIYPISEDFAAVAALVEKVQPDAIFHLAAVHAEPPTFDEMMGMLNGSVLLGVGLLHGATACRNRPVFVHAGTYWQFDGGVYEPNTFYAAAKQALHDLLVYYHRAHSIQSVTLVLYDIFGPKDTRPKLWTKLLQAPRGSTFPVSEGRQFIELVEVSDIARAFLHAAGLLLQNVPLERFHAIRSGVRITLRELLEQVHERTGLDVRFDWGAVRYWPGQIFEPWDGTILPGWRPTISPVDGICALISDELRKQAPVPAREKAAQP